MDATDRAGDWDSFGNDSLCVITTTVTAYPSVAGAFYACNLELVTGTETEGDDATFTPDNSFVIYAYNVGGQIPPNGTKLVIHAVGGRWVFCYDG